ncbi:hypothetical protein GCM10009551_053650 [Nocardiopsis tropica]|uniref:hypothetical protein n=1 Tax=Tsukamurella strandjordii TaxID=147577 RepID=UPI0031DFAB89
MPMPSKGERVPVKTRMPVALNKAMENELKERGISITDYINSLIANDLGLYEFVHGRQGVLPLQTAS